MDLGKTIRKFALQNAVRFGGNASVGAVLGKVLSENPSLKQKVKEIQKEVMKVLNAINSLTPEEQKRELEKIAPELLEREKHERKSRLPELKNVTGRVVMRFEPSPSGPLHIGHAYVLALNSAYCKNYKGNLILRIGDTNPGNIYEPAYNLIPEDANWLTENNIAKVIVQSDRLKIYYSYMEKLLKLEKAYICTCNPDKYKELILKKEPCQCRELPKEEQLERWKMMFTSYKQGEAVARIKTDVHHKNPAMRDWPAFRINENKHPIQEKKFRVWPLMNMAVAVDDIESGVTHVIRAKDHADNAKRQEYIYNYLNKKIPEALFVGRINFVGFDVSSTKTRQLIEEKKYCGWDDIRLPFLQALKRRGYQAEAFTKYAIDVGVSLNDKTVTMDEFFKTINAFNKEIIDAKAHRYFFIEKPVLLTIEDAPEQDIELDLHPDNRKGGRRFKTKDSFYLTKEDFEQLKNNRLYRLMDCLNFIKDGNRFVFDSLDYKTFKDKGEKIFHWLPQQNDLVKVEILMPDNTTKEGLAETNITKVRVDEVIQLERFGFVRCDKIKDKKVFFWFTHK
jgi:glutamyl-tRNA synthetase